MRRALIGRDNYPRAELSIPHHASAVLVNNAALRFWTSVARQTPAFAPIYTDHAAAESEPDLIPSTSIGQLVDCAKKYGIAIIEDFLPDSRFRIAREEFDSIPDRQAGRMGDGVALYERTASSRFREIFDPTIVEITSRVFGRGFRSRPGKVAIDRAVLQSKDVNDSNTRAHMDRFLPCIKVFYYPHPIADVSQSPYGYVPQSHLVTQEYLACVRDYYSAVPDGASAPQMGNPTGNPERPVLTGGNSLLLTYTNGLHRRMPFGATAPAGSYREAAVFAFYNDFTRKDLLSNAFRQGHRGS